MRRTCAYASALAMSCRMASDSVTGTGPRSILSTTTAGGRSADLRGVHRLFDVQGEELSERLHVTVHLRALERLKVGLLLV